MISSLPSNDFLSSGPAEASVHLLLAHGAGAPMTSPFLDAFSAAMTDQGVAVHRFEFAYMAARREAVARRRPPPPVHTLIPEFIAQAEALSARLSQPIAIGGKSMGGRIATMAARTLYLRGIAHCCICLGYPFHPVGQPGKLRTGHLGETGCRLLIVQGTRDPFGTRAEVESYGLSSAIDFAWLDGADHDFKPARHSGRTSRDNLAEAARVAAAFAASHSASARIVNGNPSS